MEKSKIWDYLTGTSLLVLLVWALGKSFGLIHSPTWVEMIPAFTGVVVATGILVKLGEYKNILSTLNFEFKEVKKDLKEIHKIASCLKGTCTTGALNDL